MRLFITTPAELVEQLATELQNLGANIFRRAPKGVEVNSDFTTLYRILLWSRLANRVLLPITTVPANSPEELYSNIKAIHWEKYFHSSATFAIDFRATQSSISHSHYAALTAKDAIVDKFRDQFGERPTVDTDNPDIRIHLLLQTGRAKLSLDLSGESLHKRGYRTESGTAPVKENIAAALLLRANWSTIANNANSGLVDPMCGAGTLLIEAAMIAGDIAPGLYRQKYGFEKWRKHQPDLWQQELELAQQRRDTGMSKMPPVFGYDASAEVIATARNNIQRCQLEGHIQVEQQDVIDNPPTPTTTNGLLITNPPYGVRIGKHDNLNRLYQQLYNLTQQQFKHWHSAIFSANNELMDTLFSHCKNPVPYKNGPLQCYLYQTIPAAVEETPQSQMFANRLQKNLRHLQKWAKRGNISCYRIYDCDLPDFAVAIDRYQTSDNGIWYYMQEYQPPKFIDADKAQLRLQQAVDTVRELCATDTNHIILKQRQRQKGTFQYQKQQQQTRAKQVVREGNIELYINLHDYLDTGLFLDHRPIRQYIATHSKGKRFLNLFCYTATATMHAIAGGAKITTSVDLSPTYLDWAEENMQLNRFDNHAGNHMFVQQDVMQWLQQSVDAKNPPQYDLIFIDPPTYSNSKRTDEDFNLQEQHTQLLQLAMQLLAQDGELIFSNNFRRFKLDQSLQQLWHITDITKQTIDSDFARRSTIHKCWSMRHRME